MALRWSSSAAELEFRLGVYPPQHRPSQDLLFLGGHGLGSGDRYIDRRFFQVVGHGCSAGESRAPIECHGSALSIKRGIIAFIPRPSQQRPSNGVRRLIGPVKDGQTGAEKLEEQSWRAA